MNRTLTTLALITLALQAPARAETLVYGTGFEAPAYQSGPIGGGYYSQPQWVAANGWGAWPVQPYTAGPSPWAQVTDERAASGAQSLKLSIDPNTNGNGRIGAWRGFYPNQIGLSPIGPNIFGMSLNLYIDQAADSDVTWSVGLQGNVSLGFSITPDGRIYYAHGGQSQGATFNPGFDVRNTWLAVSLVGDPATYGLRLTVSGRGQTFEQIVANPSYEVNQLSIGGAWPTFPNLQGRHRLRRQPAHWLQPGAGRARARRLGADGQRTGRPGGLAASPPGLNAPAIRTPGSPGPTRSPCGCRSGRSTGPPRRHHRR